MSTSDASDASPSPASAPAPVAAPPSAPSPPPASASAAATSDAPATVAIGIQQYSEPFSAPTILRQRSNTEQQAPWEQHEGGGLATYLPPLPSRGASPSPAPRARTPATSFANAKRSVQQGNNGSLNGSPRDSSLNQPLLNGVSGVAYGSPSPDLSSDAADDEVMDAGVADDSEEGDRPEGDEAGSIPSYVPPPVSHAHKLGQWMATAISGNDITSSWSMHTHTLGTASITRAQSGAAN